MMMMIAVQVQCSSKLMGYSTVYFTTSTTLPSRLSSTEREGAGKTIDPSPSGPKLFRSEERKEIISVVVGVACHVPIFSAAVSNDNDNSSNASTACFHQKPVLSLCCLFFCMQAAPIAR